MPGKAFILLLLLLAPVVPAIAQEADHPPELLLNVQRLRRLKRDRDRKTPRWVNFENRVKNAPDSPERGFELALYYAITKDEAKGHEAVAWALAHNSARQSALVLDWCAPLISGEQKTKLSSAAVSGDGLGHYFQAARDTSFQKIASGKEIAPSAGDFLQNQFAWFMDGGFRNSEELYALCEWIYVVRASTRTDLRETEAHFFAGLPGELLLSLKPDQLEKPAWITHIAALALVALDPNSGSSQFLQGWAMEERQMIAEGPGVAYELLWADPYLPGVGYQNMDSWMYSENHLLARGGWEPNACWIEISPKGAEQQNCPPHWQEQIVTFGRLTLIPMKERCVDVPHIANNESVIVWSLKPHQRLTYGKSGEKRTVEADDAGMWRPGSNDEGKVCLTGR